MIKCFLWQDEAMGAHCVSQFNMTLITSCIGGSIVLLKLRREMYADKNIVTKCLSIINEVMNNIFFLWWTSQIISFLEEKNKKEILETNNPFSNH